MISASRIIADMKHLRIYCEVAPASDGQKELCDAQNALQDRKKRIRAEIAESRGKLFAQIWRRELRELETIRYAIVSRDRFLKTERTRGLSVPLMRISENQYYEALDGLPPLAYERPEEDCEQFCTIEFLTANFTCKTRHVLPRTARNSTAKAGWNAKGSPRRQS